MQQQLFFSLWFFLPAAFANMAPVFAGHIPFLSRWNYPLDGYVSFKGKRLLGEHKTFRGVFFGIIVAILIAYIEQFLYQHFTFIKTFVPLSFFHRSPVLFGTASGAGALIGDSGKSFFKRQWGIKSGESWFPFDQIDYIVGGIVGTLPLFLLSWQEYLFIFISFFFLHIAVSFFGFIFTLKEKPI